jgi:hypothetical protein
MNMNLIQIALSIVSESQPCKANDLVKRLRKEHGASHQQANQTLLVLIRDGYVKRTLTGKLVLP